MRTLMQADGRPRRSITCAIAFCALAGGLVFSAAPALALETPTTEMPNPIGGTTATLKGDLNPGASGTAGYFFTYGANPNCEGPSTEPGAEATGQNIKVSTPVVELEGNTEYSACVWATQGAEPAVEGAPVLFTTLKVKPVLGAGESSGVTPFAATVSTSVNPENQSTSCEIEYGVTVSEHKIPCEPPTVEGTGAVGVSGAITGLTPATTYHYRVTAVNATGTTQGAEGEFTTLTAEAPIVEGESFSAVTSTGVKLEATVNPNYQETSYVFEYSTSPTLAGATTTPAEPPLPPAFGGQPVSATVEGLQPRTKYYYRVVATNATGPTNGAIQEFVTQATPAVTTGGAQELTRTTAEVLGSINPAGLATRFHIAYVSQESYEESFEIYEEELEEGKLGATFEPYASGHLTGEISVGSDYEAHNIIVQLRELTPGTPYRYEVVATNSLGTTTGAERAFETAPPTPPLVGTGAAAGVSQISATLTGAVDTRGLQTIMGFNFGRTPALGSPELASVISESGTTVLISASFVNDLQPETTYYYRATASSSDGTVEGSLQSFTTTAFTGLPTVTLTPLLVLPPEPSVTPKPKPKPKALTKAQKLARALKACNKKPKSKRAACRKQAHKKY